MTQRQRTLRLADASIVDIEKGRRRFGRPRRAEALTERERRVLTELAIGSSTDEAAASIHLSPHTVRSHIKSALRKLGAQTRSQGVAIAIAEGEIDVEAQLTRG